MVQNGVAVSLFSQPAFLELNGEMARRFAISLERQSIRKLFNNEAADKKEELTKTLQGRYIYLKMDAAARHRVNYFAINARFVNDDGKNLARTLAVKNTKAQQLPSTCYSTAFLNLFLSQHPFWSRLSSPAPPTIG